MAKDFVWAIDEDGKPCKCTAKPENRGKRNCKHKFHQETGQSTSDFFKQHGISVNTKTETVKESVSEQDVNELASKIDEICGTHVTEDNYNEVIQNLSPEQLDNLNKIGFEAAPQFSLPVSDDMYDDVNVSNKIYFAELPDYHIGGKKNAIRDMFGSIGAVPSYVDDYDVESNYRDGLSQREYFEKMFSVRDSQINKTVSVSAPGHTARITFYGLSDMQVIADCGVANSRGPIDCKAPGICKKCANKAGWKVNEGEMVGGVISTHLTEGLTQASLNAIHTGTGEKADWEIIKDTLMGYKSSPIIKSATEKKSVKEAREAIVEGLKDTYEKAGINIDEYNIQVLAKQLTSYKTEKDGSLRYIKDGEMCDFPSMQAIGGHNNLFLQSLLRNSYDKLTHPRVFNNTPNAVTAMAD